MLIAKGMLGNKDILEHITVLFYNVTLTVTDSKAF